MNEFLLTPPAVPPREPDRFINISCCSVLSCVRLFVTPWMTAHQASLSFTISQSLLKLMSIESVMSSNCHPLLLPSIFPSIRVFSNELALCIRLLCPPLSPGVCSNSCPLSRWRYLTISCSVTPFSFCPQSFPASGSFPVNWLLKKMAEVLMLQHRCLLWTFQVDFFKDSLFWSCSQGALKSLLQHHSMKVSILGHSAFFMVQLSHLYTATG